MRCSLACWLLAGLGWWQWQRSWSELEARATVAESGLRVSSETMGKRIVTKVEPVYPEAARKAGLQGLVVMDAVIAPDGSVKRLRPVSGPDLWRSRRRRPCSPGNLSRTYPVASRLRSKPRLRSIPAELTRRYSNFSACSKGTPRWSFAEMTGSPSSCQSIFKAGSFHATVRSCSGA